MKKQFGSNPFGENRLDASREASGSAQGTPPRDVLRDRINTYYETSQKKEKARENLEESSRVYKEEKYVTLRKDDLERNNTKRKEAIDKGKELEEKRQAWQENEQSSGEFKAAAETFKEFKQQAFPNQETKDAAKAFHQTLTEYIQACDDCNKLLKAKFGVKWDVKWDRRQYEDAIVEAKDARKEADLPAGLDVESMIKGTERDYIYNNNTPEVRQTVQETMQKLGIIKPGVPKSNQELFKALLEKRDIKVETMRKIKRAIYENHIAAGRN